MGSGPKAPTAQAPTLQAGTRRELLAPGALALEHSVAISTTCPSPWIIAPSLARTRRRHSITQKFGLAWNGQIRETRLRQFLLSQFTQEIDIETAADCIISEYYPAKLGCPLPEDGLAANWQVANPTLPTANVHKRDRYAGIAPYPGLGGCATSPSRAVITEMTGENENYLPTT
jgi:hypothetical protein